VAVWVISISENFHGSKFLQRIFNVSNVDFFPWSVGDCYNYLRAFSFSCSWDGDLRELSKLIEIFVNKKQDACLVVILWTNSGIFVFFPNPKKMILVFKEKNEQK
jgi:hypothetical protein